MYLAEWPIYNTRVSFKTSEKTIVATKVDTDVITAKLVGGIELNITGASDANYLVNFGTRYQSFADVLEVTLNFS